MSKFERQIRIKMEAEFVANQTIPEASPMLNKFEREVIDKIDKQINQHKVALSIPLSQRLRLANDMAKVMIEEKKFAQMDAQNN